MSDDGWTFNIDDLYDAQEQSLYRVLRCECGAETVKGKAQTTVYDHAHWCPKGPRKDDLDFSRKKGR